MDPINKSERKKAFWNFLLLFVISVILITATVFSGRSIPFRQNTQLRSEMSVVETERSFSNRFATQFNRITALIDSISKQEPAQADFTANRILESINSLDAMVNADSSTNNAFYKNVVITLRDFSDAKKQLVSFNSKDLDKGGVQKDLEDCRQTLEKTRDDLRIVKEQNDTLRSRLQR